MKYQVKTEVILTLNADEARWLQGIVQNSQHRDPTEEPKEEKVIRKSFWNALEGAKGG